MSRNDTRSLSWFTTARKFRFGDIASDVRLLASLPSLVAALENGDSAAIARFTDDLVALSASRGVYDQLRWIDEAGIERVRVDYVQNQPFVVPDDRLQNKAQRYYFVATMGLARGAIYVSPLDLNVEQERIETPHKPMIRLGTPVQDRFGNPRGIIIANFFGSYLLERFSEATDSKDGAVRVSLQPHLPPPRLVLSDTIDADPNRKAKAGKITAADQMTPKQWDAFAKGSNRLAAEVLAQSGLKTVFHHHCAHFIEPPAEVETLMAKTDPKLLGLCLDTGHFMVGGASVKADPVAALKQYGDRVWHVHFKDCQPSLTEGRTFYEAVNQHLSCEMGKGVVDFKAMLKELDARNYQGWIVVEQDILLGQQDNAKRARGATGST